MIYRLLFAAAPILFLVSCDDEVQYCEQCRAEGGRFSIEDRDGRRFDFSKGDLAAFCNDEAWYGDWNRPVCQLVCEGRILSDYATRTPGRVCSPVGRRFVPADGNASGKSGSSFDRSDDAWKNREELSFMEYYDLHPEV